MKPFFLKVCHLLVKLNIYSLFFAFSPYIFSTQTVIRLLAVPYCTDAVSWKELFSLKEQFASYGILFVEENPDLILCNKVDQTVLSYQKPIIILEKWPAGSLKPETRRALTNPLVVAVFKNRSFKIKDLNNMVECEGGYHFQQINSLCNLAKPIKYKNLTAQEIEKIKCVPWDLKLSCFSWQIQRVKNTTVSLTQERPIDVFFAGRTTSGKSTELRTMTNQVGVRNQLYSWHRKQAAAAIKKIGHIKSVVIEDNTLSFSEYLDIMKQTKIVVSPWGYGEWCFRDCEAMLCGAVVIKPDTDFIDTFPSIYTKNVTYVPCSLDFSDLEEKVHHILLHYNSYEPMRSYARNFLIEQSDIAKFVQLFTTQVKEALSRYYI